MKLQNNFYLKTVEYSCNTPLFKYIMNDIYDNYENFDCDVLDKLDKIMKPIVLNIYGMTDIIKIESTVSVKIFNGLTKFYDMTYNNKLITGIKEINNGYDLYDIELENKNNKNSQYHIYQNIFSEIIFKRNDISC